MRTSGSIVSEDSAVRDDMALCAGLIGAVCVPPT